jgi:hypothetical protein
MEPKIGEIGEIGGFGGGRFLREGAKAAKRLELQLFAYEQLRAFQ